MNGFFGRIPALKKQDGKLKVILRNMGTLPLGAHRPVIELMLRSFLILYGEARSFVFLKQSLLSTGRPPPLLDLAKGESPLERKDLGCPSLTAAEEMLWRPWEGDGPVRLASIRLACFGV